MSNASRHRSGTTGFFHTVEINLGKLSEFAVALLPAGQSSKLNERASMLRVAMGGVPKSLKWKMRAWVGERVSWYEVPDELE